MDNKHLFLWGAATSSHQVEGANTLNDWFEWESLGKVVDKSGPACDHYSRFREDFAIAQGLGHNAHRFSLEWSRLEPEEGRWDEAAWSHYGEVIETLVSFGIEPIVTLNHFTLPLWLYKRGGWLCDGSWDYFARFAKKAAEMFTDSVRYWLTLNEPLVYAYMAYMKGLWPPGIKDEARLFEVFEAQIRAHVSAYKAMRAVSAGRYESKMKIGAAHNVARFFPCDGRSLKDVFATFMRHRFYNHSFFRKTAADRALDFIGLNYYSSDYIRYKGLKGAALFGEPCYEAHHNTPSDWRNSLGWRIYPKGVYDLLKSLSVYGLPIIVTENGICTDNDAERSKFITEHLDWIFRARSEGVPVAGYLYWSLLDNFEWADGYKARFGIVEVDYATRERKVRPSARVMADYIKARI